MERERLKLIEFPLFAGFSNRVRAAVTARTGGVSPAPYASLNLGFSSGDDPENVIANRRLALSAFITGEPQADYPLDDWIGLKQVHGGECLRVSGADRGMGAFPEGHPMFAKPAREADAICTNEAGIVLAISVADCVPVVLYDVQNHALGAAHCGWRPAAAGILENLLGEMKAAYGTNPKDVYAGIGPGISAANYEVGEEVASKFEGEKYSGYRVIWPGRLDERTGARKFQLNLWAALNAQLDVCGVPKNQISTIVKCTYANRDEFFSYRRDGAKTGRMMLLASLF